MRYPRYTTFSDDQLVATFRELVPEGYPIPDAKMLREPTSGQASAATADSRNPVTPITPITPSGGRRTPLLKEHYCSVCYPDGAEGTSRYVRIGPDWHLFHYRHHARTNGHAVTPEPSEAARFLTGTPLPTQHFGQRMGNTPEAIVDKARELAASAFHDAILHEMKDRFRRATPPYGKKPDHASFQFSAKRAKEIGGRYALCHLLGKRLLPSGPTFDSLQEANAVWKAQEDRHLLVGCACRWTRRWELPRFNPQYRDFPPPGET